MISQQVKAGLITTAIIVSMILVAIYVWLFFNAKTNNFLTSNTNPTIQKIKGGDTETNLNNRKIAKEDVDNDEEETIINTHTNTQTNTNTHTETVKEKKVVTNIDNVVNVQDIDTDTISIFNDVNTTSVSSGDVLAYNGDQWVPATSGENTDNQLLSISGNKLSIERGNQIDLPILKYTEGNGINFKRDTEIQINSPTCDGTDKLSWNGSAFICSPDLGSTMTAGNGITINNDEVSLANTTVTAGTYGNTTTVPHITVNAQGQIINVQSVTITDNDTLNSLSCNSGEIAKYDGSNWNCAVDGGSGTTTFLGLTDTPGTFTPNQIVAVNAAGTALEYTTPAAVGTDNQNLTSATINASNVLTITIEGGNPVNVDLTPYLDNTDSQVISRTEDTISITGSASTVDLTPYINTDILASLSCSNGQVAQWNGSAWVCILVSGGANAINDLTDGITDATSVFLGNGSGVNDDLTLNNNTAVGVNSLNLNTSGSENVASGFNALYSNGNGWGNVASGFNALYSNTGGDENVAIGYETMYNNTYGSLNVAIGGESLHDNIDGDENVAVGYQALWRNDDGDRNVAIGTWALSRNIDGVENVAIGQASLDNNIGGYQNTAVGNLALYGNIDGHGNVASGDNALQANNSGNYNTVSGQQALWQNQAGHYNTAMGAWSLRNSNGDQNIGIGVLAGGNITSGSHNIMIGYDVDAPVATGSDQMNIGNIIYGTNIDGTGTTISSGNIGIGVIAPSQKLHINGNMRLTGSLYDRNNQTGINGQVLATTGSGTDWITIVDNDTLNGLNCSSGEIAKWDGMDWVCDTDDAYLGGYNTNFDLMGSELFIEDDDSTFYVDLAGISNSNWMNDEGYITDMDIPQDVSYFNNDVGYITAMEDDYLNSATLNQWGPGDFELEFQMEQGNMYSVDLSDLVHKGDTGGIFFADHTNIPMEDRANFFWDQDQYRLGIGTSTPNAKLSIFGTDNSLRLSYDGSNYADLSVNSSGELLINATSATESAMVIGSGVAQDTSIQFDGNAHDFFSGIDQATGAYAIGSGLNVTSSAVEVGPGTVTNSAGGTTVTGTNTKFTSTFRVGNQITIGADTVTISAIASDTSMTTGSVTSANTNATYSYNAGTAVTVEPSGNFGIGTDNPLYALDVRTTGSSTVIARFNNDSTNTSCTLTANGGTLNCSSDERLKKNIATVQGGLETLMKLNPKTYNWKTEDENVLPTYGFIAQEVKEILPQLVRTDEETGYLQLSTIGMIPVITQAVQDQNTLINTNKLQTNSNIQTLEDLHLSVDENLNDIENQFDDITGQVNDISLQIQNNANINANLISDVEDRMTDIELSHSEIMDFFVTINPDTLVYTDENGDLTINGIITVGKLEAGSIVITGEENNATIGESEIAMDAIDVFVSTEAVQENSRIFVTPKGSVVIQTMSVSKIDENSGFHVTVAEPVTEPLKFDWFIVEDNIVKNEEDN
ncbi:MAG: tail fiber domain-containing protein [Candidatus Moraniibacteriota bacterium]|jgi:Chaperone of endosialidase